MRLEIKSRVDSGVVIVDISGRLRFLETYLREHVNALLQAGHREFVLNLEEVPYIDSFGLGQLVSIWTSIRGKGGRLILVQPSDHVRQLLKISRLDTIFQVSPDVAEAVKSARTNAAVSA